jgi:hypothetical protein
MDCESPGMDAVIKSSTGPLFGSPTDAVVEILVHIRGVSTR